MHKHLTGTLLAATLLAGIGLSPARAFAPASKSGGLRGSATNNTSNTSTGSNSNNNSAHLNASNANALKHQTNNNLTGVKTGSVGTGTGNSSVPLNHTFSAHTPTFSSAGNASTLSGKLGTSNPGLSGNAAGNVHLNNQTLKLNNQNLHLTEDNLKLSKQNLHLENQNLKLNNQNLEQLNKQNLHLNNQTLHLNNQNLQQLNKQNLHLNNQALHLNNQNLHLNNAFNGINPAFKNPGMIHSVNPNLGIYHQAFIGNQSLKLAYLGYQPAYLKYSWFNSPWSGNAWGWGWGGGPGWGIGFGGGGWGLGLGGGGWGLGVSPMWGWGGYGGWYGPYGYTGYPLGWGFGGYGLGTLAYSCGYNPYYNPYYTPIVNQPIVYNYSNPIPVATPVPGSGNTTPTDPTLTPSDGPPPTPQADSDPDFDAAREAFRRGDYDGALAGVDAAIRKTPSDPVEHEFRALVLFARQDYKQAAAVTHSVLSVGPGWDWTTMSGLYADPNIYTQQLRALEDYSLSNPKAADGHFLLAYHYMICTHNDAAAAQLQQVVKLQPNDRFAGEMLQMVQGPPKDNPPKPPAAGTGPAPDNSSGAPADPQVPPIDKTLLPGTWSASRDDGSKFRLTMTDDGNFTWKFSAPNQKGDEFGGTYVVDGGVLALQRKEGGALAGVATFDGDGKFNFKMVGGPPQDTGLNFTK